MVYINEWLPNPVGPDAAGEYIELWNSGKEAVNLAGWKLITKGEKKFSFSERQIGAEEYLVLKRSDSKLVLKNKDEGLFLYDQSGRLADKSAFLGSAPAGKSFSRISYDGGRGASFVWSDPTPGAANEIAAQANILKNIYPLNARLNQNIDYAGFWGLLLGTAIILTAAIVFIMKRNESLSQFFFGRD